MRSQNKVSLRRIIVVIRVTHLCFVQVDADFYDEEQCDSIGSYTTEICGGIVHRIPLEVHVIHIINGLFETSNILNAGCGQTIFGMLYIYIIKVH